MRKTRSPTASGRMLLTIPELSKKYDISEYTIRSWVKFQKFPTLKSGRKTLVNQEIFELYLNGGIGYEC